MALLKITFEKKDRPMKKYEAYEATSRRKRGWQLMENDGSEDGRLVAGDMTEGDCKRCARLLNADEPKAAQLTPAQFGHLVAIDEGKMYGGGANGRAFDSLINRKLVEFYGMPGNAYYRFTAEGRAALTAHARKG